MMVVGEVCGLRLMVKGLEKNGGEEYSSFPMNTSRLKDIKML